MVRKTLATFVLTHWKCLYIYMYIYTSIPVSVPVSTPVVLCLRVEYLLGPPTPAGNCGKASSCLGLPLPWATLSLLADANGRLD